jgi:tetratricopeptide (TPR) repeat protein
MRRDELLFEYLLDEHLTGDLVPRDWLLGRVKELLGTPRVRFIVLEGGAGTGKSTFLASLVREPGIKPRYFIRRDSIAPLSSGDGRAFLVRVGHQIAVLGPELMDLDLAVSATMEVGQADDLIGVEIGRLVVSSFRRTAFEVRQSAAKAGHVIAVRIGELIDDLSRTSLADLTRQALIEPAVRLAAADPSASIVLLIDGLDEIGAATGWTGGEDSIIDWLTDCAELPENLRVVVTTRPLPLEQFYRRQQDRFERISLGDHRQQIEDDIAEYAAFVLAQAGITGRPGLDREVARKADDVFLYAALWARTVPDLLDPQSLPDGLDDLYEYLVGQARRASGRRVPGKRAGDSRWKAYYQPLLATLAIAFTPLPPQNLARYLGFPKGSPEFLAAVLEDLGPVLRVDHGQVRFCHGSLADFLTTPSRHEYWSVQPSTNHLELARSLIGLYSHDWASCEDVYALTYTARHLVAALEEDIPEALDPLVGLLGDVPFGRAKARHAEVGFGSLVTDHIAAWTVAPDRREELARGLARVVITLEAHDQLHDTLGYRTDGRELHELVLTLLGDEDLLREHAAPDRQQALALVAAHSESARIRRLGGAANLERAGEILRRLVSAEISGDEEPDNLPVIFYDFAYLEFLLGDAEAARSWFHRSIEVDERRGNTKGLYITTSALRRLEFHLGELTPDAYRAFLDEAEAFFSGLGPDAQGERWIMTLTFHRLELALATDDPALADAQLAALEDNTWLRNYGRTDDRAKDDLITIARARTELARKNWTEAIALFEQRLGEDLDGDPDHREEMARDLYGHATALVGAGRPDDARRVLALASDLPDGTGAWLWKPRIRALQDTLE